MKERNPRQNYLGARGWIWGGNYKLERYLYLLHRITGLGLILFVVIHLIITTIFRIQGQDIWEAAMTLLSNPWFKVGEYLVVLAFVYHGLNGLRLTIQELGLAMGKPIPPVYPWKDALRKQRPIITVMLVIIVILGAIFFFGFLRGGR